MFYRYVDFAKSNWVICLPILAAAISLFMNVFMKNNLTPLEFGKFSLVLFSVNIMLGFGVVGFDQVILKLSIVKGSSIIVSAGIIFLGVSVFIFSPLIIILYLRAFKIVTDFTLNYYLLSFLCSFNSILVIIYNLKGDLKSSYILNSFWKLIFYSLLFCTVIKDNFFEYESLLIFSLVIPLIIIFFIETPKLQLQDMQLKFSAIFFLWITSVISLFSYQLFESVDRFLIVDKFDLVVFGEYFFFLNFFLAPSTIVISYFNAKKLSKYKASIVLSDVNEGFLHVLSISLFISSLVYVSVFFGEMLGFIEIGYITSFSLVLISLLCVIRNCYLYYSNIYKLVSTSKVNLLTSFVFGLIPIVLYSFELDITFSLEMIVFFVAVFWITRLCLYMYVIKIKVLNGRF